MWYRIRRTSGSLVLGMLSLILGISAVVIVLFTTQSEQAARAIPVASLGDPVPTPITRVVSHAIGADDVVAALNCARSQQSLPPYERSAEFDQEAQRLLEGLHKNGQQHVHASEATFPFIGQLLLNNASAPTGCAIGGFDTTRIRDLSKATRVGIAVTEVQSGAQPQMTLAVIVGR